ncbi:MAG: haloalkane dehalogenase [Actinomycetia bacterium]|nr:haloalkane dehalogenase [Actinomycetes bacterium]
MEHPVISAHDPHPRRVIPVLDSTLSFVDTGEGAPVVFLHGNPTWSYLWRNVIPHVAPLGRCLAPDLVGMGNSGPAAGGRYRLVDHRRYLDAWFEALALDDIILVVHDWGSALGFDWARRHPDRVRGIAYMEAIVRPLRWEEWPNASRGLFQAFRSPAGESLILERNLFVERVLPGSILRRLSDAEMEAYRRPFRRPGEARRPTLTWPREIPVDGEPPDVVALVQAYADWLASTPLPKLFINGEPGAILVGPVREFCRTWPNQEEVTVPGVHFLQEDSPDAIGMAVARFVARLRSGRPAPGPS